MLSGLSADSGQLASLGPMLGLTQLAKGEISRSDFERQCAHRSPHELEVSVPRPAEEPGWIDTQLAVLLDFDRDAPKLLARQAAARTTAMARLRERCPAKLASIRRCIDRFAKTAREREDVRSEFVRVYWVLRSFVQRAGMFTGLHEDVFFCRSKRSWPHSAATQGFFRAFQREKHPMSNIDLFLPTRFLFAGTSIRFNGPQTRIAEPTCSLTKAPWKARQATRSSVFPVPRALWKAAPG